MKRFFLLLILSLAPLVLAVDMIPESEQFYVAQGLFNSLNIIPTGCEQEDALINFACGIYPDSVQAFQTNAGSYIAEFLPGLMPASSWFDNAGTIAQTYQSNAGTYIFAYNSGGKVVVVFTPAQ